MGVGGKGGSLGEHRATLGIKMSGEDVQHIDQPAVQAAEALRAGADAAIDGGAPGRGQFARQLPLRRRRDTAAGSHALRGEGQHGAAQLLQTVDMLGQPPKADQPLVEQRMHQAQQQKDITAGLDRQMLIGLRCGLGAARIDDDDAAAALAHRTRFAAVIGHGPEAAVADQRIGAKHQEQIAALDVGHRNRQPMAEHQPGAELLGHLVECRGRKQIARSQSLGQTRKIAQQADLVRGRVADDGGHCIVAMLGNDGKQTARDLSEGFVPARLDELAIPLDQRLAQPIRVFVQILQ